MQGTASYHIKDIMASALALVATLVNLLIYPEPLTTHSLSKQPHPRSLSVLLSICIPNNTEKLSNGQGSLLMNASLALQAEMAPYVEWQHSCSQAHA